MKMIVDENMLSKLEDEYSRNYFTDILQSYYSKNYRAAIVLLYSFVIFDLLKKLENMEQDGIKSAKKKLNEIRKLIDADEPYSKVEQEVVNYFHDECNGYFRRFSSDIEYLKTLRHKCAHLNLDDSTLYTPKDYQVSMLINSMFDNIFSVRSPIFIDIFKIAQPEIERATTNTCSIWWKTPLEEDIEARILKKYVSRMSEDSLKRSFKTFLKLLFLSEDQEAVANRKGLYAFTYSMTDQISKKGYSSIYRDNGIKEKIEQIDDKYAELDRDQKEALLSIFADFPEFAQTFSKHKDLFDRLAKMVLSDPKHLFRYKDYYGDRYSSIYECFVAYSDCYDMWDCNELYKVLSHTDDFDEKGFLTIFANKVGYYNGFDKADTFMNFLKKNRTNFQESSLRAVKQIYDSNDQFYKRRNSNDDQECFTFLHDQDDLPLEVAANNS